MDATLAFALGKFQEEQTETMRTEVAKVQAEREQQVATLTERQRKRAEHHQARASELKKKMVDVESILPHLDELGTEVLAGVVDDCAAKLTEACEAAQQEQAAHAASAAERMTAVLQVELDESKTLKKADEEELKELVALLQPGDDIEARLAAAEARMLGKAAGAKAAGAKAGGGGTAAKTGGGGGAAAASGAAAAAAATPAAAAPATCDAAIWSWKDDSNSWKPFSPMLQSQLEAAHTGGKQTVPVDGQRHVDVAAMKQIRNDDPSRHRPVRRVVAADDDAQPTEGMPPSGHEQRFRNAIDKAEAAVRALRRRDMERAELTTCKGLAGGLVGEVVAQSHAETVAAAAEAADRIGRLSEQMEATYRARSKELQASQQHFLEALAKRKVPTADEAAPPAGAVEGTAGGGGAAGGGSWVRHTNAGRAFYRRQGDDASMTLSAPAWGTTIQEKEEVGPNTAWFESRWRILNSTATATAQPSASVRQMVEAFCEQTLEVQQRHNQLERDGVEGAARHRLGALAQQRQETSRMASAAVQYFSGTDEAAGRLGDDVVERIRNEQQHAERAAEAAVQTLRDEIGAQTVVDVGFLSEKQEDVAGREPVPMTFHFDADFSTWDGRKDKFLADLATNLGVPPANIAVADTRAGSIYVDLNVQVPAGMTLNAFINKARLEAAKADSDIRQVLIGSYDLDLPENSMDPRWNKTYGPGHTKWAGASPNDGKDRGKEIMASNGLKNGHGVTRRVKFSYYCPEGWKRYGLQINVNFDEKYKGWPVCYHGTAGATAALILDTALRQSTGQGKTCFGEGVYLTPSIRYASCEFSNSSTAPPCPHAT